MLGQLKEGHGDRVWLAGYFIMYPILSLQFVYEEKHIDVPENKEWFEKYRYHIPVIHLDGQFLMKHRVNERLLKEALHSKSTSTIQ